MRNGTEQAAIAPILAQSAEDASSTENSFFLSSEAGAVGTKYKQTTITFNYNSSLNGKLEYTIMSHSDNEASANGGNWYNAPASGEKLANQPVSDENFDVWVRVKAVEGENLASSPVKGLDSVIVSEPISNDTSVSGIAVKGTDAVVDSSDATVYNVELPFGTVLADLIATDVVATATDSNASVATATTADSGATWTVVVKAEDGTTTETYTINISVEVIEEVQSLIEEITALSFTDSANPTAGEITAVETSRTNYEALTAEQKALVTNVAALEAAEKTISDAAKQALKGFLTTAKGYEYGTETNWMDISKLTLSDTTITGDFTVNDSVKAGVKTIYDGLASRVAPSGNLAGTEGTTIDNNILTLVKRKTPIAYSVDSYVMNTMARYLGVFGWGTESNPVKTIKFNDVEQ